MPHPKRARYDGNGRWAQLLWAAEGRANGPGPGKKGSQAGGKDLCRQTGGKTPAAPAGCAK